MYQAQEPVVPTGAEPFRWFLWDPCCEDLEAVSQERVNWAGLGCSYPVHS